MILIVDFGSQTAHLIGRRLRQIGAAFEFVHPKEALFALSSKQYAGIILSGGPSSVYEEGAPRVSESLFNQNLPILGICYGWQLMAFMLGGKVEQASSEYGPEEISIKPGLFNLPQSSFRVFMSHGDSVTKLPQGFTSVGSTQATANAWVENTDKNWFGTQFHPELDHTEYGLKILEYFVKQLCHETCTPIELDIDKIVGSIRDQVGDSKVICAVSGGVDSTVAAFLIGKAIDSNLIPVYIESGLMRAGTAEHVKRIFGSYINADLVIVDAKAQFMEQLKGITDPEQKRKRVGKLYVDLFATEAAKHPGVSYLGQGTIRSDVIESKGSKHAAYIKAHHNVGGLPKDLPFKLIEPLRDYYKDEVRQLGKMAGLPDDIIDQHPFPGPGYAVRIRGEVTPKRLEQEIQADAIVMDEIQKAGLYKQVFQVFPIMTGAYSTAVKGDGRAFAEVVAIRAYESKDIMTARWAQLPYELLQTISSRIVNEVTDVSRVVYDITTKPPATMEWE